jgi:hypothetical protein
LADQVLTQFQQHEEAWTRVDGILQASNNPQTKVTISKEKGRTAADIFRFIVYFITNTRKVCSNTLEYFASG